MDSERYRRLVEVFAAACEKPDAERPAFLDAACANDRSLRVEVEKMLRADEKQDAMLDESPIRKLGAADPTPFQKLSAADAPGAPMVVGRYRILRKIGQGGM